MQVCHSYRHLKANKLHPEAVAKAGIASVWRWGKVPNISNLLLYSCQLWSLGNKREGLCLSPLGLYLYFNPKSAPPTLHSRNLPLGIDCWDTPKDTHTHIHNKKYMTTSFPSTQAVITVTPWGSVQRGFQSRIRRVIFCLCVYVRVCVSACVCV